MQRVLDDFPAFFAALKCLDGQYESFLLVALDDRTELSESFNVLRRRYRPQIFH
jgi:hypothetical protein